MDPIEEILNLRELVTRLSNRVAALEGSSSKKIELVKCSKCGVERHPLFKLQCLDPQCEGGLTIGACPPKSLMTSEPCHGLDIKNIELVTGKQWGEFKSIDNNQSITLGGFNLEVGPDYKDSNSIGELNGIIAAFDSKSQVCRDQRDKYNKDMSELTQYWRDNPDKAPKY